MVRSSGLLGGVLLVILVLLSCTEEAISEQEQQRIETQKLLIGEWIEFSDSSENHWNFAENNVSIKQFTFKWTSKNDSLFINDLCYIFTLEGTDSLKLRQENGAVHKLIKKKSSSSE